MFSEPKLSESVEDEDKAIPAKLPGNHAERLAYESRNANSRLTRINYKDRGSLVAKISQLRMPDEEDLAIPAQSRGRDASTMMKKAKAKKNKVQEVKRVNADVFIPSVVSIANLARLLNVKLGMSHVCQPGGKHGKLIYCRHITAEDEASRHGGANIS